MNLHIFDEGGDGGNAGAGNQSGNGGTGGSGQRGSAGYTFEQAEEIANNRAEKATRAALADFYRKQGLSEDQITTAIADFKAKQKAQQPDVDALTQERDAARQEAQQLKNEKVLSSKGVKAEDMDYVLFKVNKLVDDKTDFAKAADDCRPADYFLNSTIVTPASPSPYSPCRKDLTYLMRFKCCWMALRRAPVPLPCTTRTFSRCAR